MSPQLGSFLAQRSREWLEEVAAAGDVVITRDPDTAQGVMSAARILGADLVVVGVRPAQRASRKTADKILDEVRSSVLFVPLRPDSQVSWAP
jgi:nucleotide-binding universal stress UspA family protein